MVCPVGSLGSIEVFLETRLAPEGSIVVTVSISRGLFGASSDCGPVHHEMCDCCAHVFTTRRRTVAVAIFPVVANRSVCVSCPSYHGPYPEFPPLKNELSALPSK